jgi:hypothetical protein
MEHVDEGEAQKVADDFLYKIDKVHWKLDNGEEIAPDGILTQAKMYLGFKRLQKLYNIDLFANKCMPEMSNSVYGYGHAGCIATCLLNEDGITMAREADVPAGPVDVYLEPADRTKGLFRGHSSPEQAGEPADVLQLWVCSYFAGR